MFPVYAVFLLLGKTSLISWILLIFQLHFSFVSFQSLSFSQSVSIMPGNSRVNNISPGWFVNLERVTGRRVEMWFGVTTCGNNFRFNWCTGDNLMWSNHSDLFSCLSLPLSIFSSFFLQGERSMLSVRMAGSVLHIKSQMFSWSR